MLPGSVAASQYQIVSKMIKHSPIPQPHGSVDALLPLPLSTNYFSLPVIS